MEKVVDAIEEGQIIQVTESYARSEGLPIIRKPKMQQLHEKINHANPGFQSIQSETKRPFSEMLQHPSNWKKNQVTKELIDNFHWQIRIERKRKNLTRKQFAKIIDEPEENIKMIEAGFLPSNDFILINKVQAELNINLRKDQKDFSESLPQMLKKTMPVMPKPEPQSERANDFSGSDIEILEDEI